MNDPRERKPSPTPVTHMHVRPGIENRRVSRHEVRFAVSFEGPTGERSFATCRNIGLGGAFIELVGAESYTLGTTVVVHLPLPGFGGAQVPLGATVRWTAKDGIGVQFASMGVRETRGLMELIHGA
ncbi:MAG: PilZ domain-containing protein [Myxococcales bacterium]|nr:PilZ domain-containing protein [Myxococcales bacterium]